MSKRKGKRQKKLNAKYKAIKKTFLYRTLGLLSSFLIGYLIFGNWEGCTIATITIELVHTLLYYALEKIYERK
jgi:uncharacterized membrane protein